MEKQKPRDIITEINNKLQKKKIAPGLPVGSLAPEFNLQNSTNEKISLMDQYDSETQFIVLNFYRGKWCGICKKELLDLQNNLSDFNKYQTKIIAISPQTTIEAADLKIELKLEFDLLSDPEQNVIKEYRLHYTINEEIQKIYTNHFQLDLQKLTANNTWELPVPGTYIIDKERKIIKAFVEMNYRLRLSASDILEVVSNNIETKNS